MACLMCWLAVAGRGLLASIGPWHWGYLAGGWAGPPLAAVDSTVVLLLVEVLSGLRGLNVKWAFC